MSGYDKLNPNLEEFINEFSKKLEHFKQVEDQRQFESLIFHIELSMFPYEEEQLKAQNKLVWWDSDKDFETYIQNKDRYPTDVLKRRLQIIKGIYDNNIQDNLHRVEEIRIFEGEIKRREQSK